MLRFLSKMRSYKKYLAFKASCLGPHKMLTRARPGLEFDMCAIEEGQAFKSTIAGSWQCHTAIQSSMGCYMERLNGSSWPPSKTETQSMYKSLQNGVVWASVLIWPPCRKRSIFFCRQTAMDVVKGALEEFWVRSDRWRVSSVKDNGKRVFSLSVRMMRIRTLT